MTDKEQAVLKKLADADEADREGMLQREVLQQTDDFDARSSQEGTFALRWDEWSLDEKPVKGAGEGWSAGYGL